ncbi:LysR family transcriptional regulator [Actinoplanes sp. NPDC049265]|uniref:LysR family transcriptional regulator n=1 Tax=Actinoplanes sp. NPDC049265 TaxID=3363902 RepID=UPI003713E0C5
MADLENRELEYFIAVAEDLHFGRAAVRLSIAQPALSKAIRRIEARLGVPLFVRSSRRVELTPGGEALLEHGRHALNAVSAAVRNARRAAEGQSQLRLVLKPGGDAGLLSGILAAYARQPGARRVDIVFSGPADRADFLLDGRADVGLLYAPFDDLTGLAHETLIEEDRVAVLPAGHRLAARARLGLADLAGETMPGPEITDLTQLLQLVRLGRMAAVVPRSLVEPFPPGVTGVPVSDAPPSRLLLAWPDHDRRPLLAAFVAAAMTAAAVTTTTSSLSEGGGRLGG